MRQPSAYCVRGTSEYGHRADDRADLDLLVPLDDRLRRAAVLLAPHEHDLGAELDVGVDAPSESIERSL